MLEIFIKKHNSNNGENCKEDIKNCEGIKLKDISIFNFSEIYIDSYNIIMMNININYI
jgi:hypothetical protein